MFEISAHHTDPFSESHLNASQQKTTETKGVSTVNSSMSTETGGNQSHKSATIQNHSNTHDWKKTTCHRYACIQLHIQDHVNNVQTKSIEGC